MKLYSRQEMQKGLEKKPITSNLVICQQDFLWNPQCEYFGCLLYPDHDYNKKEKPDPRTNPWNPVCFRCGKRWGACMDGL